MSSIAITAAVARAPGENFSIEAALLEAPREDEILVRIFGVGICHSDVLMRDSQMVPLPSVLGHEGSGIVERVGDRVTKVAVGDRVAISFSSCGECKNCKKGQPAGCSQFFRLNFAGRRPDGSQAISTSTGPVSSNFFGQSSFANYALTKERNVVKVPDSVPLELLGPLGCGIQTGAGGILRALDCEDGSSLVILGAGSVGLSAVMAGAIRHCNPLIVIEPQAARRKLALDLGATHALDPRDISDLAAALRAIVPEGLDYAFDTSGRPDNIQAAAASLAAGGEIGLVGGPPDPRASVALPILMLIGSGITVRGINQGDSDPDIFIPELITHYQAGRFPFDRLIKTYDFDQINQAIDDQHSGDVIKAVLLLPS